MPQSPRAPMRDWPKPHPFPHSVCTKPRNVRSIELREREESRNKGDAIPFLLHLKKQRPLSEVSKHLLQVDRQWELEGVIGSQAKSRYDGGTSLTKGKQIFIIFSQPFKNIKPILALEGHTRAGGKLYGSWGPSPANCWPVSSATPSKVLLPLLCLNVWLTELCLMKAEESEKQWLVINWILKSLKVSVQPMFQLWVQTSDTHRIQFSFGATPAEMVLKYL